MKLYFIINKEIDNSIRGALFYLDIKKQKSDCACIE